MADNVPITAGTGTNIATDDVGGVHYQRVKLVSGVLDATDVIPGDATNGLAVDVTRVQGNVAVTQSAAAQADGHSVNIGALADADSANTLTGLLKKIKALLAAGLPTSLGAQGALIIEGIAGGTAVPISAATLPSHPVTNAGTFAVQAAQTGTWNINNISGTVALPTGAATEATLNTLNGKVTACNTGAVVLSSGTVTNLSQLGGTAIAMNTGTRSAGTQRVTIATDDVVPAAQSGTWNITNVSGAISLPTGAATAAKQPALGAAGSASTDVITVQGIASMTPVLARLTDGTNQSSISSAGALFVGGSTAHGTADAGNPLKIGAKALAHGTNPTAVSAAQRSDLYCNRHGIPWVIGGHPNIVTLEAAYTASQTDTAIVTVSSGTKIVVTQIQVVADNANTAFPSVRIGFGTANTPTTTGVVLTHPGVPAGGGVSRGDGSGILGIGADDADLRITCGAPTTGSIRVLVSYYTIES